MAPWYRLLPCQGLVSIVDNEILGYHVQNKTQTSSIHPGSSVRKVRHLSDKGQKGSGQRTKERQGESLRRTDQRTRSQFKSIFKASISIDANLTIEFFFPGRRSRVLKARSTVTGLLTAVFPEREIYEANVKCNNSYSLHTSYRFLISLNASDIARPKPLASQFSLSLPEIMYCTSSCL